MFEEYRNRLANQGKYIGEQMRIQTRQVTDAIWMNSTTVRPVCVHTITQGVPPIYDCTDKFKDTIYAHFEKHKNYNVGGNAVDYKLVFQLNVVEDHPEIKVGSYVCIQNAQGKLQYWLITYIEEENDLVVCRIMLCNWSLKWVAGGKIHECLGVLRGESADAEGVENAGYISTVESKAAIWLPTNLDSNSISINTRFLISDIGRTPPQAWKVSKINTVLPIGLTKITLEQEVFNSQTDNEELMIADYYKETMTPTPIEPIPDDEEQSTTTFNISYNGTKPTIKVGGSAKVFTAQLPEDNRFDIKWSLSDGVNTYGDSYDNYTQTFGDYTITTEDRIMKIVIANNYKLIGTILTISAECVDGSAGSVKVEVI